MFEQDPGLFIPSIPSLLTLVNSLFDFSPEFFLSLDERQVCTLVGELFAKASQIPFPFFQMENGYDRLFHITDLSRY